MVRTFDPSLIEIRNNPFSSTKSESIADGIFMKELISGGDDYIPSTSSLIHIGISAQLFDKVNAIEGSKTPQHILILAEYGQGKSFSLKKVQDKIYIDFNGAIISY